MAWIAVDGIPQNMDILLRVCECVGVCLFVSMFRVIISKL